MGGQPYWSWYGFNSQLEWYARFVSWCTNKCGYLSFAKYILGGTMHYMTDAEALDWICSGFGFDRSKVTILYEINEYKINRHLDSAGL